MLYQEDWKNISALTPVISYVCDSFQFLSSLLDTLLMKLAEKDFQYLSQKFDSDKLDDISDRLPLK